MITALTRPETIRGALAEYESFAELLDSLDDAAWHAPTRCEGFEVRDIAGHVVGLASDVAAGVPRCSSGPRWRSPARRAAR